VLARAFNALGLYDYDIASHNCEHFASWVLFGAAYSAQCGSVLRTAGWAIAPAVGFAALSAAFPAAPALFGSTRLGAAAVRVGLRCVTTTVSTVTKAAVVKVGCSSVAAGAGTGQLASWLLGRPHRNCQWAGDWETKLPDMDPQKQLIRCLLQSGAQRVDLHEGF
jgi:hypothetical protein